MEHGGWGSLVAEVPDYEPRHGAHDRLTGLPNRLLLGQLVDEVLRSSPPDALIGLCFVDFDRLGDRLLSTVAGRLDRGLTAPDTLLARIADTEFVVLVSGPRLVPGATAEVAAQVAHLLTSPFQVGGHEVTVCAGIGVVERLVGETTYEDLLSCAADLRVRQAKVGDRSRWMAVDLDRACALVRTR